MCYCQSGYFYDEYYSLCMPRKKVMQNCTSTYECIDNAYCTAESIYSASKFCQCSPSYYYDASLNSCINMETYGTTCTSKTCDYNLGLYCLLNTNIYKCSCNPDYFWTGSRCQLSQVYLETCTISGTSNSCRASRNLNCNPTNYKCECSFSKPTYNTTYADCQ